MSRLTRSWRPAAAPLPLLAAVVLGAALTIPAPGSHGHSHGSIAPTGGSTRLAFGPAHTSDGSAMVLGFVRVGPGSDGGGCPNPDGVCAAARPRTDCSPAKDPNGCAPLPV
jgi:hypothetical protein